MRVYITVREHENIEYGYSIDKLFTDYKEAQESLLQQGYRILNEDDDIYTIDIDDEEGRDGYRYALIYHKNL